MRPRNARPVLSPENPAPLSLTIDDLDLGSGQAAAMFRDGYYDDAVRRESQVFINEVKALADRDDLEGEALFNQAFSAQSPLVAFSDRLSRLEQDEHDGFRHLGIGLTRYIRNRIAHSDDPQLNQRKALIWLAFISALREDLQLARPVPAPPPDGGGTA